MNKNLVKQFNFWRILGITALVCTFLLTMVLCAESLKPGDKSKAASDSVSDSIKGNSFVYDNDRAYPLTGIICHQSSASAAVGVKRKLTFTYIPKMATDKRLTFSSDNPDIVSVDDDGVLSFNSFGRTLITAKSQVDPSVSTTFPVYCDGVKVDDVSEIDLLFTGEKLGDYIPIPAGTRYVSFVDKNGKTICKQAYEIESNKPEILHVNQYNNIVAVNPGQVTLTITNKDTNQSKDFKIIVTESSNFTAPKQYLFKSESITINKNDTFNIFDCIKGVLPDDADFDDRFCWISCSDYSLFATSNYEYTAIKVGEATFTATPYVKDGTPTTFRVIITETTPTQLIIIGNDRIVRDENYTYTAFDGTCECECIKWSVVKGDAHFTDEGKLVANKLGDIVIRATSTLDETIYADLVVRVSLFERFATFVRKVLGHFSAFVVLGIGFAASMYLLCGCLRKFYTLFSALGGFLVASITEILQLPVFTANRGSSFDDVLLDTAGVLCGVGLMALLIWVVLGVIKLRSPQKHAETKFCISKLSFKTAFCSKKTIGALLDDVDTCTTTTVAVQESHAICKHLTIPDGATTPSTDQTTIVDDQTTAITESVDE